MYKFIPYFQEAGGGKSWGEQGLDIQKDNWNGEVEVSEDSMDTW